MTPRERACILVDRYLDEVIHVTDINYPLELPERLAIIAVNLLMEEAYRQHDYEGFISYWKEVKQEIENYG
jgi:hypothetical protein